MNENELLQQIESNHLKIESQLCIIEALTQERADLQDEIDKKDDILEKRYKALELAREALKETLDSTTECIRYEKFILVDEKQEVKNKQALEAIEEALK